ncbi:hypothetical protein [Helicobacter sp. MIT 01-3238]|uniref:hypothetical protein n=1 Tax=Helicobacter sp. MIT 01-3238 TaxID=398627 RepID=UPI000E1E7FF3|nr:hypothetical protein [Helicobacter sp. MIT 01-3238]RDU52262.1 hypothetical protein CQA40_07940 [Helicobacter sp. MIT 01-3238]
MTPTKTHLAFAKNALISLGFYTFFVGGGGSSVYALDYTDYSLPSSITLNGGQRQDTITSIKSPQGWQMTTIGLNRNPHLSINGTATSQYTLQVRDDTTTFYSGGFSIGSGVEATLMSIHTLAIESGSVSVGSGASFSVISSGNTINPQGSEYGGESKVRFARGTSLNLAQNARANFSNANFFIHDGSTAISQGASLTISATKAIRFQNEFINNGGSVNLTGSVYNVGYSSSIWENSVSTFTINGGSVSITGDFYNGAESKDMSVDSTGSVAGGFNALDSAFGGGGNLFINGGSMSVSGTLISQMGGDSINGGGISNPRNSSISIYGGTLSATGGVQNKSGSTLTIGALNGKMGQIQGNVTNSGQIIIDAQGASGGTHQFITGTLNMGSNISLRNGNTEFAKSNLQGSTLTVNLDTAKIASFTSSLDTNQKSTLNALGNQIYTTNAATSPRLAQSADLLNQSAFTLLSAPFSLISILKSNLSYPISYTSHTSKIKTNSLEIGFIGGILQSSSKISGGGGVRLGYAKDFASYFGVSRLEINAGYIYSAIKDSATSTLLSYASSLTSHTAGAEAMFFTPLTRDSRLWLKIGLGGFMTFIDSSRGVNTTLLWGNPSLKSSLSLYQIALDSSVGYEVVHLSNFIATPYLGLHQSANILPSFTESSGQSNTPQSTSIAIKTQGYKAYHLGLIVGLEARLQLKERVFGVERDLKNAQSKKGVLLGKIEYEYLAFHSQKSIEFAYPSGDFISFGTPHSHKVRGALGFQKDFTNGVTLGVEASIQSLISAQSISKTLGQSLYFYGANAAVGYRF